MYEPKGGSPPPMIVYLAMIEAPEEKRKFEALYERYRDLMFYTADQILGDTKDSEDVVHEAFLKIIDHLEKIGDPLCPQTRALIVTITENKAIDLYRRRKRRSMVPFDEAYLGVPDISVIEQVEDGAGIAGAIARLPGHYREVLLLKYAHGYSTEEVAELLSLSPENVKKLIQRARKKLEGYLEESEV